MFSESYVQSVQYQYCKNAMREGYIHLSELNSQSITIGHLPSADFESGPICEWNFIMDEDSKVNIEVSREVNYYEDIIFKTYSKQNGTQYFPIKQFSDCQQSFLNLAGEHIAMMTIRVKAFSASSNYSMTINQVNTFESKHGSSGLVVLIS